MKFFLGSILLALVAVSVSGSSDLSPAIEKLMSNVHDVSKLKEHMKNWKTDPTAQFLLKKLTEVLIQLKPKPEETKAIKHILASINDIDPTKFSKQSESISETKDINDLVDFNQLLVTFLELLKNDEAVQNLFNSLSSPIFANMFKRLLAIPATKEVLVGHYGMDIDMIIEETQNLFNWNLKEGTSQITEYREPLQRFSSFMYKANGCDNCPGCTACLPCCNLRKYLIKTPRL